VSRKPDLVVTELSKIAAEGDKNGHYYVTDITVKEVLERVGQPNTETNQNYVRYKVAQLFPKSTVRPGQGDNGGFIHLVIWSK